MSLSTLRKANRQEGNKNKNRSIVPPIPFDKDPPIKFSKADWREFNIPVQEGSDKTMAVRVPVLERGTCEQYLAWFENVTLVLKGFKIEAPTARLNLMEQFVKGYMKEKLSAARTKTVAEITKRASKGETALDEEEQFNYAVQELTKSVFPKKALMLQKFYMQYYMRKPVDMSVSEYRARVT